ncbi:MAG: universal stress protein [Candidatus Rokubacteria bacterium]|nr:universal stress protein [Candidatus Rokubacteria bacterium]
MAKRILVPLDREERGEAIVDLVAALARQSGATVRLLHVGPLPQTRMDAYGRVIAYQSQDMERIDGLGRTYLRGVAATRLDGVPVELAVRFGEPAEEILAEAEVFGADLIAVSGGKPRWWRLGRLKGIAARLLRRATAPVMLVAAEARS